MLKQVTDYALYRWRYIIGYVFLIASVSAIFYLVSFHVPGALRQGEIDAALQSGALSVEALEPRMVIDLPYHILQRATMTVFGVTILGIKLPSVILGVLTTIGIFLLVRTWFRRNVAVIATITAVTSSQFLFLLQDGTSHIAFSFIMIWLLFAATYVTRNKAFGTLWKVLTGVLMATAVYTPLGIYLVIAVLTTTFFHPHIRYTILRFSRPRLWIGIGLALVSLTPLIYATTIDSKVLLTLLGLPTGEVHLMKNLTEIVLNLFGFAAEPTSYVMRPAYSLGLFLLIAVGVYKLITYKYTARSYITLMLGLVMAPLVLLNPERLYNLFPLACLMIALGIATLITDWYRLFPRNPYARIAGLLPLSAIVLGIVYSGVVRFTGNYLYSGQVLSHYSTDTRQLQQIFEKNQPSAKTTLLVVTPKELPFYAMMAYYDTRFTVTTTYSPGKQLTIVSHDFYHSSKPAGEVTQIITNRMSNDSDRFYIYKTPAT
ncbi:MAG TPA: glycosyltransferase family 39 protein [Candidatus Saccharimonas sp.]|nr:glycosyltransferase family 39 protein [Candidatus Saccharimonas sp.]